MAASGAVTAAEQQYQSATASGKVATRFADHRRACRRDFQLAAWTHRLLDHNIERGTQRAAG